MESRILTVTQLNAEIKQLIEGHAEFDSICVRGELSNYKVYPSGHHYFTLKDSESSLRCVLFRGSASKLRFRPENGMAVLCSGKLNVYPRDGAYQLICSAIIPEGTGDLQIAFEQLKKKLDAEGLFDSAHKKPLPSYPEKIAVITSSAGAAVHDMIKILSRRWPMSKVLLLPVRVQGAEAPPEIVGAIRYANKYKIGDVIITGRGGGSIEDLWAFNDERVARAIYDSEIPVISAVGHEPDVTIADYVADARASTPSNAAEIAVPDRNEQAELIEAYRMRSLQAVNKRLSVLREKLDALSSAKVLKDPTASVDYRRMELDRLREAFVSAMERQINRKKHDFIRLTASLDAMSPLKVLTRGYCAVSDANGQIVKTASQLKIGDDISIRISDGTAGCTVNSVSVFEQE